MWYYSTMSKEFEFENYIRLYKRGVNIHNVAPLDNQTDRVFRTSNTDIRIIDRDMCYRELSRCPKLDRFTVDTKFGSHRFFYCVPIQTPSGAYVGFIYRSINDKSYASVYRPFTSSVKKVPYMYGFFNDFKTYYRHGATKTMPILVCEGCKDAMILKQMYPYALSNNTASLGISAYVLAQITDKILLCYDNDETGHKSYRNDRKTLTDLGVSVDRLVLDEGFKDVADYFDHPNDLNRLREQLKLRVKGLIHGTVLVA